MAFRSLLSLFDRQSARSAVTGQTGSIIGVLLSIVFLAIVITLYMIVTVQYFNGIYYASEYSSLGQKQEHHFTSGRDFKVAIVIKNKITGALINHTELLQNLDVTYKMVLPDATYLSYMRPCESDYFIGNNFINPMHLQDCIIIPYDTDYNTLSILQIKIQTKCLNPFTCVKQTGENDPATKIFIENKFEIYFTSVQLNQKADSVFYINKQKSTQYNNEGTITSTILIYYNVVSRIIDDSFLPIRNRRVIKELSWNGRKSGNAIKADQISNFGLYLKISTAPQQFVGFRYYKKIDYLIGIIGGGTFLFFLIFWIFCNYLNRQLEKMNNTSRLMLQTNVFPYEGIDNFQKVNISICYILKNLIPCYKDKQTKIVSAAEQKLNFVNILKRKKTAERNLEMNNKRVNFRPKDLIFQQSDNIEEGVDANAVSSMLQIPPIPLKTLRQSPQTKYIYENNPSMLAIANQTEALQNVIKDEQYDKVNTNISSKRSYFYYFKKWAAIFFRFFDVFGAKPNFIIEPHNYSIFGCCVSLLIIICSVLTFAITLRNMGQYQVFSSYNSLSSNQINFQMVTGLGSNDSNYQLTACFGVDVFNLGWITGISQNQSVQVKFFTYQKFPNGTILRPQYDAIRMKADGQSYFQSITPLDALNFQNCLRPPHGTRLPVAGSPGSDHQAYFGITLKPYCFGTPSQCQSRQAATNQKFAQFINSYPMFTYIPINKYNPQNDTFISEVFSNRLSQARTVGRFQSNWALVETQYLDELQLLDDTQTWLIRQPPIKILHKLNYDHQSLRQYGKTQQGVSPKYEVILRSNGQSNNIVKRGYKIDFLFGIIGGSFFVYFLLFGWTAKIYNAFKARSKYAEIHYQQQLLQQRNIDILLHLSKIPLCMISDCCGNRTAVSKMRDVDNKVKKDLNILELVKKVQNCWRLSASFYASLAYKDVGQIYMKQKIDERQKVIDKQNIQAFQNIQSEFLDEFDEFDELDNQLNANGNGRVANDSFQHVDHINQIMSQQNIRGSQEKQLTKNEPQQLHSKYLNEDEMSFIDMIKQFDLFSIKSQFTFHGQRRVQSICGGICCLLLTLCIVLIVAHFVGINISRSDYMVGLDQVVAGNQQQKQIILKNENFKLMLTFFTKSNFNFLNISAFSQTVGIKAVQRTYQFNQQLKRYEQNIQEYDLISCQQQYLDGWVSEFTVQQYYSQIQNGLCLSDTSIMKLTGEEGDPIFSNFYISIYNKGNFSTYKTFIQNYFPVLHLPVAVRDFNKPKIKYAMHPFRQDVQLFGQSTNFNISFTKQIYKHENDFAGEQILESYVIQSLRELQQATANTLNASNAFRNFTFGKTNRVKIFTIDIPGIRELFGLVGGVIILFIFTFSCIAESFNNYRMKYLIGRQLYIFDRKEQVLNKKKKVRSKVNIRQINNYSELDILVAWVLSPLGYIQRDYNYYGDRLRHITLIIKRVEQDIDIYKFTQKLSAVEDQINRNVKLLADKDLKLTRLYPKQVYFGQSIPFVTVANQFYRLSKSHRMTSFEQKKLQNAKEANVDPRKIFNDKYIWRKFQFGLQSNDPNSSAVTSLIREQSNNERNQIDSHDFDQPRQENQISMIREQSGDPYDRSDKKREILNNIKPVDVQDFDGDE